MAQRPVSSQERVELPPGLRGPRGAILVELKRLPGRTAKELSGKLSLSLSATRYHLRELEAEGLVAHGREQRAIGAPVHVYRLQPEGEALFPRRYEETLTLVLDAVVDREGRAAAVAVLERHFGDLARRLEEELDGAPSEQRIAAVTRVLSTEGFMPEWRDAPDGGTLSEHNCAIRTVAERFPEICDAEEEFLERALSAAVDRRMHVLDGCSGCEYRVRFDAPPSASGADPRADVYAGPAGPAQGEHA